MNEEKIITIIKEMLETNEDIFEETGTYLHFGKSTAEDVKALLDLYNQEKEKNKKLEEENRRFKIDFKLYREMSNENSIVIDMMAKDISNTYMFPWKSIDSGKVREYYFKKARGEENE